jgi:aminocarboxymuconate-semialdehyde decarboxylase
MELDDPAIFPILEAAQRLSAAVFVHPWEVLGGKRLDRFWGKWLIGMPAETAQAMSAVLLGGVLDRLPNLRIAFAHGGGSFPYTLGRTMRGFATRPDLCATQTQTPPRDLIRRCYLDTLVHDPAALHFLIDTIGSDRLAMGSDYPFPLGEETPGAMIKSMEDLTGDQKSRLLGGTALEFLGITAESLAAPDAKVL